MKILIQRHEAFRWFLLLALTGYAIWAWNVEAGDLTVLQPSMTGDFENLRSLLETRGWRVERTPDGSILLFPLRDTPQAQKPAAAALTTLTASSEDLPQSVVCAEEPLDLMLTAGIKLPVNTAEEAWKISENWLLASGYTDLGVGRIRDINWIYVVNIVDQRPPYRSRNELIINKRSGQLLPLY
ncbi:MAG: hypothetical protein ABFS24_04960 [Pseudomonadota bacterium]